MSNYVGYRKTRRKQAISIIKSTTFPPQIDSTKFQSNNMNCYAFALNLPIEDPLTEFFIPGSISQPNEPSGVYDSAIKWVKKDLYSLGLRFREIDLSEKDNIVLNDGEYVVAVYREISTWHDMPFNFHLLRRDFNGVWHGKEGFNGGFHVFAKIPDLTKENLKLEGILAISKK